MNCACNNSRDHKSELFDKIGMISFVCDDLRLYLDTHPDNREALSMMCEYLAERNGLMDEYRAKYGSLEGYKIGTCDTWVWNDPPMPWDRKEGGC